MYTHRSAFSSIGSALPPIYSQNDKTLFRPDSDLQSEPAARGFFPHGVHRSTVLIPLGPVLRPKAKRNPRYPPDYQKDCNILFIEHYSHVTTKCQRTIDFAPCDTR